jgi:hypothetical protein
LTSRFGFGLEHRIHWALPFIGYGLIGYGITSVPAIAMTYGYHFRYLVLTLVLDSYLPVGFESLVLVNALKQIFAFGFAYGIVPWVTLDGYGGAFGAMAGLQFGVLLLAVPLWYYGKQIRHKSGGWKVILC